MATRAKRFWETFKSDYEPLPIVDGGHRTAPSPCTSYAGRNPCGGIDNREKMIASFEPFADFDQPSFTVGVAANPLVGLNNAYTPIHFKQAEFSAFAAHDWSEAQNLHNESHPAHRPAGSIAVKAASLPMREAEAEAAREPYYLEPPRSSTSPGRSRRTASSVRRAWSRWSVSNIPIKTSSRPQWVWSTFEQVDNVPPAIAGEGRGPDAKDDGRPYVDPSQPATLAVVRLGGLRAGRLDKPATAPSGAEGRAQMAGPKVLREFQRWITTRNWSRCWTAS